MLDLVIIFLVTLVIYHWWTLKPKNFPPGPPCVPLLGSIPFIESENLHFYLEKVRPKYGPVIGLKFASSNAVAFCGAKEVQDAFKIDELQGRPPITIASQTAVKGIILTEGSFWSTQRQFTLRHLRDFGFGKNIIEGLIMDEIEEFLEKILRNKSQVQADHLFNNSVINVLWAIMAGTRFSHDDKDFKLLLDVLEQTFRSGGFTNRKVFIRRLIKKQVFGIDEVPLCEKVLLDFVKKTIEEHKKTLPDTPRDFIDAYLLEINKNQNKDFTELSLISICLDLFAAGAESVGNTLSFCVLYMILYPELQKELYDEIKEVIGEGNRIYLQDKPKLQKLEAFLAEVERMNTIAPVAVPRRAMSEVVYNGYRIPKDSFVIISIWSLLRDKEHWGDPDNFRPSRFLNSEGKFVKDEWLSVFGIGKRICPGESLARQILFLFLTAIIREFEFSIPPGNPKPSTIGLSGFTSAPRPFEVSVKIR